MSSSNTYLLFAIIAMAAVTLATRALPVILPRRLLDRPWLHRLNQRLPLAVLVLLIMTSLSYQTLIGQPQLGYDVAQLHLLSAQIGALLIVLLIYHISRQLLISMVAGIAAINLQMCLKGIMQVNVASPWYWCFRSRNESRSLLATYLLQQEKMVSPHPVVFLQVSHRSPLFESGTTCTRLVACCLGAIHSVIFISSFVLIRNI